MKKRLLFFLTTTFIFLYGCEGKSMEGEVTRLCSESWYQVVEQKIASGDGKGHGPDIGSEEWKSVIEFKLGVRGEPNVPDRDSDEWCRFIDEFIQ